MNDLISSATFAASLRDIPACLHPELQQTWDSFHASIPQFARAAASPAWPGFAAALAKVWAGSEFVARSCLRDPQMWDELIAGGDLARTYVAGELRDRVAAQARTIPNAESMKPFLRKLRHREAARLAWRDLAGWANLQEVMTTLSDLADACLQAALPVVQAELAARYGAPVGERSRLPQSLVVFALGKLGACELNFSSDIDLVLAYPEDGEIEPARAGAAALSNHEFFLRVARELVAMLSAATGDGFVFRVDLRLRPNGASGPLALSFDAMEHYYQTHGREWERYAWIKARAVAGDRARAEELLARLRPFVYRKYFDYGAIAAIREMKATIAREVERKGMEHNIKTGVGGIREIEFIGQVFQLIRGGREPPLQAREIQTVLAALGKTGYLMRSAVDELTIAYRFLRNCEHRLQMVRDEQTHVLPGDECARERLAYTMGYANWDRFAQELRRHRECVHKHFERVFADPPGERNDIAANAWTDPSADTLAAAGIAAADVNAVRDLLRGLHQGAMYAALSVQGRERLDRLMPLLIAAAAATPQSVLALTRLVKLIEAIGRRPAYFSLLTENPLALAQLVKLCAASAWIADWISRHPILLDELLHPAHLYADTPPPALAPELAARLTGIEPDDLERQMEITREFHHAHVLRVAAAEIANGLAAEQVRHRLCAIAEAVLAQTLTSARAALAHKHGDAMCGARALGFAVIAYGKLGSYELGYASDLDFVFMHESCAAADAGVTGGARAITHEQFFARLGQRIIHLLTTRTAAGILYPVDMRLRPSGQAGTLVTQLDAFRAYQRERAWTWEHQALVRARAVAGDSQLCAAFTAVRREILCLRREPGALAQAVLEMRARMRAAQTPHDAESFDLKHDAGGIVDIEFMVQYWVLRWAADHPELTEHTENVRLLQALSQARRIEPAQMQALTTAYHRYLSIEQRLKLMEHRALVARAELGEMPAQVQHIWQQVFANEE